MKVFKKILLGLLLLVSTISLSQGFTMGNRVLMGGATTPSEITLTSTSTLASWSPFTITNPGTTLDWTVSGGVTIATTTIDDPDFNFSGNTGTANVLIENVGDVTEFIVPNLSITSININDFILLGNINIINNSIPSIDLSANTVLTSVTLANNLFTSVNVSTNTVLFSLQIQNNSITSVIGLQNTVLIVLQCEDNSFSATLTNQILADLVAIGLNNGTLTYRNNETGQGITDRATLITRGWTIGNFGN